MAETVQAGDLKAQLLDIIAREGLMHRERLVPEATLESLGVASYDMVLILMAIEEKFGVYISVDTDLAEAKTLDDLLNVLAARIEDGPGPGGAATPPAPSA